MAKFFSRFISVLALLSVSACAQPPVAKTVATYPAQVAAVNDCPDGFIRISMSYRDSPRYDPLAVFRAEPPPVTACAALQGVSQEAAKRNGYVRVTYSDGKYFVVPIVRIH